MYCVLSLPRRRPASAELRDSGRKKFPRLSAAAAALLLMDRLLQVQVAAAHVLKKEYVPLIVEKNRSFDFDGGKCTHAGRKKKKKVFFSSSAAMLLRNRISS